MAGGDAAGEAVTLGEFDDILPLVMERLKPTAESLLPAVL